MKNKIKALALLPNEQGFEFIGIKKDNTEVDCRVVFDVTGSYVVITQHTNERVFNQLKGWK